MALESQIFGVLKNCYFYIAAITCKGFECCFDFWGVVTSANIPHRPILGKKYMI